MTQSPSTTIRLAVYQDIETLQRLIAESVKALSVSYYNQPQIESALRHIFGVDTQLILDGTYYVAEQRTEIIACGGWSKRRSLYGGDQSKSDVADTLLNPATEAARIRAFFVHPRWARRGVGRQLLVICEEAARAAGFKRLELVATLPGEPLYSALGYCVLGRMELATPDGESLHAFRMGKNLLASGAKVE
jgi:GNAT superfamily N-acetyltransferase